MTRECACRKNRDHTGNPIADELKDSTIEKVLAKSDLELGLDVLLGRRKL